MARKALGNFVLLQVLTEIENKTVSSSLYAVSHVHEYGVYIYM